MTELLCQVESMQALTPLVCAVRLTAEAAVEFKPGQYAQVVMGAEDKRPFSIANPPNDQQTIELHIGCHPQNTYANQVLERMRQGEIAISLPHGSADYRNPDNKPVLLVAGGTGYSYCRSILYSLVNSGTLAHPVSLYWGAKSLPDLYEYQRLTALAEQHHGFEFCAVVEQQPDDWGGKTGWVHRAVLEDHADLSGYQVYVAGPFAMANVIGDEFGQLGLPKHSLFGDAYPT